MLGRQGDLLIYSSRRSYLAASFLLMSGLGIGTYDCAFAQTSYNDPTTAEGWAWAKITKGEWADFDRRCAPRASLLDPDAADPEDACRQLKVSFLQDILTRPPWRDSVPFNSVRIKGALVTSDFAQKDLNLENVKIVRSIEISGSRMKTGINPHYAAQVGGCSLTRCRCGCSPARLREYSKKAAGGSAPPKEGVVIAVQRSV